MDVGIVITQFIADDEREFVKGDPVFGEKP